MKRHVLLLFVSTVIALTGTRASTQVVGLVAAYGFEEASGPTVTDLSGNGNTGTIVNATRTTTGKYGSGLTFNGTTAYVQVADATSLDLAATGTVAVWMNQTVGKGNAGLIHKGQLSSFADEAYSLQHSGVARPEIYVTSGSASKDVVATAALSLSVWHHVAATWDASGTKLYIDGVLNASATGALTVRNTTGALFLGAQYANGFPFQGTLDEVRIYNRALTVAEIQSAMATPLVGAPPPPGDTTPPTVTLTAPAPNAPVSGTVPLQATASDNSGVAPTVQFLLNGAPLGSPVAGPSPYGFNWDTTSVVNGPYTLAARATDGSNNAATTATINVTVSNVAPPPPVTFTDAVLASGYAEPTFIAFSPQGDIYVGEKSTGKIKIISGGVLPPATFLTLSDFIPSPQFLDSYFERGLLGMTFDLNYNTNHFVYVYYTICKASGGGPGGCANSSSVNRVARFKANATGAAVDATAGQTLIIDDIPSPNGNHNAGWIGFGPIDGKLYIAVGDGGGTPGASPAQNLNSLNGKILRLNPDGTIPADNPLVGQASVRTEIWAYGFRNPWRCRFHPDGRLFCGDVGESSWEEIDVVTKGANYGWPTTEGPFTQATFPQFVHPIFWYDHTVGAAITGGDFGSQTNFPGTYQQSFFFGDYVGGWIKRVVLDASGVAVSGAAINFLPSAGGPVDIVAGPDFNLYYIDILGGALHRVSASTVANHSPIAVAAADLTQGPATLVVTFSSAGSSDPDSDPVTMNWDFGDGSSSSAPNPLPHPYAAPGTYTVTLTVSDNKPVPGPGTATLTIKVGVAPVVTISQPVDGAPFIAGQSVPLVGSATDDDPPAALSPHWKVTRHHDTHTHPFVADIPAWSGSFTPDSTAESSANIWYEIALSVTDSTNLTTTKTVFVYPQKVNLTFASNPPGLQIVVDGQTLTTTTPVVLTEVVGFVHPVSTASPQTLGGSSYQFQNWADGGTQSRSIVTPGVNTTYTANFTLVPPPPPPSGLVAAYGFEEASGPTVTDLSGNGNTGTIVNATRTTTGKYGSGLTFNGTTAYVQVADASSLDLAATGTVAVWMFQTTARSQAGLIHKGQLSSFADEAYSLQHSGTTRQPEIYVTSGTASKDVVATTAGALSLSVWHHVAATWDASGTKLYIDGVLNASATGALTVRNTTGALIIGSQYPNGFPFQGILDEVRIYNRALTLAEIQSAMATPLVGAPPPGDTTPPTVTVSAPASPLSGTVTVSALASDTSGIAKLQLLLDNQPLGPEVTTAQTSFQWNTTTATNGAHTLSARATDNATNVGLAANVALVVSNSAGDTIVPTVSITSPSVDQTLQNVVTLCAAANDNVGIANVSFVLNSGAIVLGQGAPAPPCAYAYSWNTQSVATGDYMLSAIASDAAGNQATATVHIIVLNVQAQPPGLVAAWGFNEGYGIVTGDTSGNNHTATMTNATWTDGRPGFGKAVSFSGSAFVRIPDRSDLDLGAAGTASAWIWQAAVNSNAGIVHKGFLTDFSDEAYSLQFDNSTGQPQLSVKGTSGSQAVNGAALSPTTGWHYIAATWSSTGLRMYVDGVLTGSIGAGVVAINSAGDLFIGSQFPAGYPFAGLIDEVRLYNRALSQAEIQNDMVTPIGAAPPVPQGPIILVPGDTLNDQVFTWDSTLPLRSDGLYSSYSISLVGGKTYTFATSNQHGGTTTDTYLYVLDPNGNIVAQDNDSNGNLAAKIVFVPPSSGSYLIKLRSTQQGATGYCTLDVSAAGQPLGTPVLPDLVIDPTWFRDVILTGGTTKLLQFSNGTANLGPGTLDLYGIVQPDGTTFAYQRVWNNDGSAVDYLAGTFLFIGHGGHNHWHFADFVDYNLRSVMPDGSVGAILKQSAKVTFCVEESNVYDLTLPNAPQNAVHTCSNQGISVGWVDVYVMGFEGQSIDITGVPSGTYWLETVADPDNLLKELNENNNVARIKISINQANNSVTILP